MSNNAIDENNNNDHNEHDYRSRSSTTCGTTSQTYPTI